MELAKGLEVAVAGKEVVLSYELVQEGKGSVKLEAKLEFIAIAKKFAADSSNKIDDAMVEMLEKALA